MQPSPTPLFIKSPSRCSRLSLIAGCPPPPLEKMMMASAPSNASLDLGQSFECTTVVNPGTVLRHFCSSRQPARYSCSPAPWLGLPAMNTIFLSAANATNGSSSHNATTGRRSISAELLDPYVLELDHHGWTGVELERQDPGLCGFGFLFIHHVNGLRAVDEMLEVIAFGDDHVIVPVLVFDFFLNVFGFAK